MAIQRSLVVAPGAGAPRSSVSLIWHTRGMGMPPPPPPPPPPPGFGSNPPPPPTSVPPAPYGAVGTAATYPPGYPQPPAVFGERANFGTRLGAWLLDGLLYGLLSLVFVIPGTVLIATAFRNCRTVDTGQDTFDVVCPPGEPSGAAIAGGIALILLGMLVVALLYVWAMGKTGQTWGARIVGVKVIDQRSGAPIGFWRALGRSLFASFISGNVFYLGYLWMLWDDEKQTWQDKVVNSVVVRT